MQLNHKIIGMAAVFCGAAIAYGTLDFREVPGQDYGAAFFPRILAGCFIVLGLVFALKPTEEAETDRATKNTSAWMVEWAVLLRQLSLPLAGVLWILAVDQLGFIATTFVMLLVLMQIAKGKIGVSIAVAAGLTLALYFVFGSLLRVPLPFGLIERVIS